MVTKIKKSHKRWLPGVLALLVAVAALLKAHREFPWVINKERIFSYCLSLECAVDDPGKVAIRMEREYALADTTDRGQSYYFHHGGRSSVERSNAIIRNGYSARGNKAVPLDGSIEWSSVSPDDVNFRYQVNALYFLEPLLVTFLETGERQYFEVAKIAAFDWIEFNLREKRINRFKWYDMATGVRAAYLAILLDTGVRNGLLSEEEVANLYGALREHVVRLKDPDFLDDSNHAFFQLAGLKAVCGRFSEISGCKKGSQYASEVFNRMVIRQFGEDGMHLEHSNGYHEFALRVLDRIFSQDVFSLEPGAQQRLQSARRNSNWFYYPWGEGVQVGDTDSLTRTDGSGSNGNGCNVVGASDGFAAKTFKAAGYGVLRNIPATRKCNDAGMVFLTSARHSRVHRHADDLSVVWGEGGERILVDAGKYTYDQVAERAYVKSTRAHNTIEFDGRNYDLTPGGDAPTSLEVRRCGNFGVIEAERWFPELLAGVARRVVWLPGTGLLVDDVIRAKSGRSVTQWFHLPPGAEVAPRTDGAGINIAQAALDMRARVDGRSVAPRVIEGQQEPRLQGWYSPDYGELIPAPALSVGAEKGARRIQTAFLRSSADEETVASLLRWTGTDVLEKAAPESVGTRRAVPEGVVCE